MKTIKIFQVKENDSDSSRQELVLVHSRAGDLDASSFLDPDSDSRGKNWEKKLKKMLGIGSNCNKKVNLDQIHCF